MPDPATRSFTVFETSTSPARALTAICALISTAMPASLSLIVSHSPVCSPALISIPKRRAESLIEHAARIARAGPSKPATTVCSLVSTSRPLYCSISLLVNDRNESRNSYFRKPAVPLEPVMFRHNTVASTRSDTGTCRMPSRNFSISSRIAS